MPKRRVILTAPGDFNLAQTLTCGQAFRWKALPDESFLGIVDNRTCRVHKKGEKLIITGDSLPDASKFWRSYFDLDTDYAAWRDHIAAYHVLKPAVAWSSGIRLLRQPPWEALVSFIISQNNHLSRITGIVDRLCCLYGEPLGNGNFAFPTPERLSALSEEDFAPLRCGYRTAWIADAAQRVQSGEINLQSVQNLPLQAAVQALSVIRGVGPKVANCVLLYGLHRLDSCPVDVWVNRGMQALLPKGMPEEFLPFAGVVQQYIFHYMRTCPDAPCQKRTKKTAL